MGKARPKAKGKAAGGAAFHRQVRLALDSIVWDWMIAW
jgi:hypothetical protein